MSYIGASPTTAAFPFDQFSGNGSITAFTLSYAPASTTSIVVSISGVVQNPNTYSVSGLTLTFSPAPPTGTNNIGVLYLGLPVQVGVPTPGSTAQFALGSAANPSITFLGDTNTGIYSPGADTLAFTEGGTEVMRIDSAGNVGIGTNAPSYSLDVSKNQNASTVIRVQNSNTGVSAFSVLQFQTGTSNYTNLQVNSAGAYFQISSSGITTSYSDFDTQIWRNNAGTERARIDSGGNLLVGTTSGVAKVVVQSANAATAIVIGNTSGTALYNAALFYNNNLASLVGQIAVSGTTCSYNSLSDYRLKENIAPMTGALEKVAALKPCTYTWKADGSAGQGFIAHELAEVVPDAVTGEKDAVNEDGSIKPQGIDTSFLVATLTAALQELKAELDVCKAEIAALKGV